MGDITDDDASPVTLKQYIDALLEERQKHFEGQIDANRRAVEKAEQALDHRLEAMNDLRNALREAQTTFATRADLEVLRGEMNTRFGVLLDPQTGVYSQLGRSADSLRTWAIALLTAILLLIIGLVAHVLSTGGKFL